MLLVTRHFGEIEVDGKGIITFSEGLPGFNNASQFVILENGDEKLPFKWMQSIDVPELAFVIADPFMIMQDYDIDLSDAVVDCLGIEKTEEVLVYSIVVVPDDTSNISINLKAPIIINTKNNKGMQVILDTDKYNVRHYILKELHGREVTRNACAGKEEGAIHYNKRRYRSNCS
jgi:flagellar assembly factor FliW